MRTTAIAAALLGFGSSAYAQIATASQNGLSYSFSVPDTTASSGSGDVYIQISGPTTFSWIGIGSGSRMSGSTMMLIYTNAAGNNVTLSPRTASGQSEPKFDSSIQAVLTEGSGVKDGIMTANIRCSSCAGKFDITSSSASLIYAAKSGSALNSDSTSQSLSQHSDSSYGPFSLDMTKAKNSANSNPFASGTTTTPTTDGGSSSGGNAAGPASCVPESQVNGGATGTAGSGSGSTATATTANGNPWWSGRPTSRPTGFPFGNGGGDKAKRQDAPSSCPSGFVLVGGQSSNSGGSFGRSGGDPTRRTMLIAHGVLAGLAFAVLFPLGAISIRLLSFPGLVWFHAGIQIFAYLFYIIAFGLGVHMAQDMQKIDQYHPVIGIILFAMIFFMPILGWLHHSNFKKYQRRTGVSYAHLWTGRLIIPLGIINGGLGFKFANNTRYGPIVYGIVAAILFVIYVVAVIIGERRRAKNQHSMPPKYDDVLMENQSLRDGAPVNHREFYGRGK